MNDWDRLAGGGRIGEGGEIGEGWGCIVMGFRLDFEG